MRACCVSSTSWSTRACISSRILSLHAPRIRAMMILPTGSTHSCCRSIFQSCLQCPNIDYATHRLSGCKCPIEQSKRAKGGLLELIDVFGEVDHEQEKILHP